MATKRSKARKTTRKAPAKRAATPRSKPATDGRAAVAEAMRDQARALVDEQSAALISMLRDTEALTRQASLTEVELGNQRQVQARMRTELDDLLARKAEADAETARLTGERDAADKARRGAEQANKDLAGKISALGKAVAKLEKEAVGLTREREKLEQKRLRLEEDLVRLRKIRDDYLAGIARFRALREEMIA